MRRLYLVFLLCAGALPGGAHRAAAAPADVQHPFILWTREEAAAIRKLIGTEDWAKRKYEQGFASPVEDYSRQPPVKNLFRYLVMGDQQAAEAERETLIGFINHPTLKKDVWDWQWHHADTWQQGLRYDILQDQLTPGQRKALSDTLRIFAKFAIEEEPLRGFLSYGRHPGEHVLSLALKDPRVVANVFACRNGIKDFVDNLGDGYFCPPALSGHILLWAQACERLGLNEFGYGYTGPNGGSIRKYLEGLIHTGFPRIDIPGGMPYYARLSPAGKGGAQSHGPFPRGVFDSPIVIGYLPAAPAAPPARGKGAAPSTGPAEPRWLGGQEEWVGVGAAGIYAGDRGVHRMNTPLLFELAHRKWPDAGFGYFLAQMRAPDEEKYYPSLYFGLKPIDPRASQPPAVRSVVNARHGFAMLRAEESPAYWESPAPVAVLNGGTAYTGGAGPLALDDFYAFNRPLYTTPMVSNPRDAGAWSVSARAHNTVIVDNLQYETAIEKDQYVRRTRWPQSVGQLPIRSARDGLVKFASVRAKSTEVRRPNEAGEATKVKLEVWPDTDVERAVFLTRQYLLDVYRLASDKPRQYHWLLHAVGKPVPDAPSEWKSSQDLDRDLRDSRGDDSTCLDAKGKTRFVKGSGAPPSFRFDQQWSRAAGEAPWSLAVVQSEPPPYPAPSARAGTLMKSPLPDAWFNRGIGVRITMLGQPDTTVYHARPVEVSWRAPQPRLGKEPPPDPDKKVDEIEMLPPGTDPKAKPPGGEGVTDPKVKLEAAETPLFDPAVGGVTIVAARKADKTIFVTLHEPLENARSRLATFRRIQQDDRGVAVAIAGADGSGVNDRVMVRLGDDPDQPITLAGDGESFTFSDRAYIRIAADKVEASGPLTAMKLKVQGRPVLILNGNQTPAKVADGVMTLGQ